MISAIEEAVYFSTMMFVTVLYGPHPAGRWRYLIIPNMYQAG